MSVTASSISYRYLTDTKNQIHKFPVFHVDTDTIQNITPGASYEGTLFWSDFPLGVHNCPFQSGDTVFNIEGNIFTTDATNVDNSQYGVLHMPGTGKWRTGTNNITLTLTAIIAYSNGEYRIAQWGGTGVYDYVSLGIVLASDQSIGYYICPQSEINRVFVNELTTGPLAKFIMDNSSDAPERDPYAPGGTSGPGGGEGEFDWSSDPIDFPPLPSLSATDTGFITLFNPTVAELQSFANYVWNDLSIDNFHKVFNDPMDAILGLSIVPVAVPNGGRRAVTVGNLFAVDIVMNLAASQYVELDCGTIFVKKEYDGYLDYDPYTKTDIYLPYIGFRPLRTDDIMGKNIHVKYHVDILSGACCAYVKCGDALMYSFVGQCSSSVPITGGDWTNVINGVLQMAAAIGSMVATEGAAAPFVAGQLIQGASAASKPQIEKSGGMSGTGGMMAYQKPYLIRTIPRQALPKNQNRFTGYPSMITMTLGDCSGYTEIEAINLEGLTATAEEMAEIENLLQGGVYF